MHDDYFLNILLQNLKVHIPNMIIYTCRWKAQYSTSLDELGAWNGTVHIDSRKYE